MYRKLTYMYMYKLQVYTRLNVAIGILSTNSTRLQVDRRGFIIILSLVTEFLLLRAQSRTKLLRAKVAVWSLKSSVGGQRSLCGHSSVGGSEVS